MPQTHVGIEGVGKNMFRDYALADRHIDQPHLHALLALPAVDRKITGRMHLATAIVQERSAERLTGDAERNRIHELAVARSKARADVVLADRIGKAESMGGQR